MQPLITIARYTDDESLGHLLRIFKLLLRNFWNGEKGGEGKFALWERGIVKVGHDLKTR